MRPHIVTPSLVALLSCVSMAPRLGGQVPAAGADLLFVGDYYPGKVRVVTGDSMLGLFAVGDGWELVSVPVRVDPIHNPCTDRPGATNGRRVSIARADKPFLLVRGVARLRPGPIRTLFTGHDRVFPGDSRTFEFKRRVDYWQLAAFGTVPYAPPGRRTNGHIRDYMLVVSRSPWDRTQVLMEFHARPNAGGLYNPPTILWVGDLDRDGRMDLFLNLETGEGQGSWALYLSSVSGADLLERVAELHGATC